MKLVDNVPANWAAIVEIFGARGIPIATHDDTTVEHVQAGLRSGATSRSSRRRWKPPVQPMPMGWQRSQARPTWCGAARIRAVFRPANSLGKACWMVCLRTTCHPSLLQAVLHLAEEERLGLPKAMSLVTSNVADMVGLADRGRLGRGSARIWSGSGSSGPRLSCGRFGQAAGELFEESACRTARAMRSILRPPRTATSGLSDRPSWATTP